MTITIHVPALLRDYCDGQLELSLRLRACAPLSSKSSGDIRRCTAASATRPGAVRRHVNLFVNTSHMRDRDGLDTALAPGDVVTILPAVSGG